jgi:hypothetical protein
MLPDRARLGGTAENTLPYLVFRRASEGSVPQFLTKHLKNIDFLNSWLEIVDALSSIGSQILDLHEHKVLHRYVGWETEIVLCRLS